MKKLLISIFIFSYMIGTSAMAQTPEPKWHSVRKDGDIEIRLYEPMIIAQVIVKGERYAAINEGFRQLAGYIFGGNTANNKIAMTAPVLQQPSDQKGEKLAMTAPVIQESTGLDNEWKVQFVMPANYTLETLPKPNNPNIKFIITKAYNVAVIKFSWFSTDDNLNTHKLKLMAWLKTHNITITGTPSFAFYDPPWTLPFLRRNEVMVEISIK